MIKKGILLLLCFFSLTGVIFSAESKNFIVVIDPGHGGRDGGAVRGKYKEKDINLGVALVLGDLIKKNLKDVEVVYTRSTDKFIDLDVRTEIANKQKANLFISIHTNSTDAKKTNASGADTYILGLARSAENLAVAKRENSVILLEDDYSTKYEGFDPNSPESYIIFEFMTNKYMEQSLQFASSIQADFKNKAKRNDRGVKQAGFLVLRKTSMPSVLIELGFINNPTEAAWLSTKAGQKTMAEAIFSGFENYKIDFDKKQGGQSKATSKQEPVTVHPVATTPTETVQPATQVPEIISPAKTADTLQSIDKNRVEFRVQFLYSAQKLPDNSPQFKGLSPVGYYEDGGYKYTYGSTTDWDEAIKLQTQVRAKFEDAFVVKLQDGKRVK